MVKEAIYGEDDDIREKLHKFHATECEDEEERERKDKFSDLGLDLGSLYPLTMLAGDFGSVLNTKDPNDEGHPVHPTDKGMQMVMLDPDWLGARVLEFRAAGQSEAEAKRHAGECAFTSFVMMMLRLIDDFIAASRDWNVPEKSAVEVASVIMTDTMMETRKMGIPSSVIKMWASPVMLAMLDRNDMDELLEQLKNKLGKEKKKE